MKNFSVFYTEAGYIDAVATPHLRAPANAHRGRKRADVAATRPWSTLELDDLEHGLRIGVSIEVIGDFIERDVNDVRCTAAERGLLLRRARLPEEALN